jgi:carbonic anhydrase
MKIAKYVVIAQMVLSAVLVVIFVTRSMASNRVAAKAAEHAAEAAASGEHGADKGQKAEGAADKANKDKSDKASAEKSEHGATSDDDGETVAQGDGAGDGAGASKASAHKSGPVAQAETGEFKLDVVKPEPAAKPSEDDHGHHGKPSERDKGRKSDSDRKGEREAKSDSDRKSDDDAVSEFGTDPKVVAQNLLAGNARFIEGHRGNFDLVTQRQVSAGGQHPGVMVLGCADSRVPPELIFDRGVGEMFVVRSAGNIAEPVAVGSLEYAAEHLHTKVLLVLGHEKCGAVQAALSDAKLPSANLEAMVDAISPAVKELKAWMSGDQLVHMAVEANVRRQAEEVMRRSSLLRQAAARKELTVLKAVYDIQTGRVRPL